MRLSIKPYLPKGLFGRAALILLTPVVVVQFVVSIVFIQRHYENVTEQLTSAVARDIQVLLSELSSKGSITAPKGDVTALAQLLGIRFSAIANLDIPKADARHAYDLAGRTIISTLYHQFSQINAVDLSTGSGLVVIYITTPQENLRLTIERRRFSASNPHQLLVLMVFAGAVMSLISFVFMRNQLTPITRMAIAAEAFGRGQYIPYTPRGSIEVRAAGHAFLAMRARIERQMETRTLMLSGVSHDLRSPLTRLKLGLALLPESDEIQALMSDITDMERLLDEFLAFARGDAMEETTLVDPADVLQKVVARVQRGAGPKSAHIQIGQIADTKPVMMRPEAVARALENLIGNAQRYGSVIKVSLQSTTETLRFVVEDNGPGIPPDKRQRASEPFARLDEARNPNQGGGVGLGLAIAADVARSHGGALVLGESESLGGLRAELRIAV
jgi:two-component system osmolarity sensor histidine kinase EnvZ